MEQEYLRYYQKYQEEKSGGMFSSITNTLTRVGTDKNVLLGNDVSIAIEALSKAQSLSQVEDTNIQTLENKVKAIQTQIKHIKALNTLLSTAEKSYDSKNMITKDGLKNIIKNIRAKLKLPEWVEPQPVALPVAPI